MSNEKTVQYALRYHKDSPYFFNPNENGEGCSGSTDDPEKAFRYDSIREAKNALLCYVKSAGAAMTLALDAEIVRLTRTGGLWEVDDDPEGEAEPGFEYGTVLETSAGFVHFNGEDCADFMDDVAEASVFSNDGDLLLAMQTNLIGVGMPLDCADEDGDGFLKMTIVRRPAGWQVEHIDE